MRHSLEILVTVKSCYPKHPCQKPTKHVVDDHAEIEEKIQNKQFLENLQAFKCWIFRERIAFEFPD